MLGTRTITKLPPAVAEPWYSPARACIGCEAKILNRYERDGVAFIRVLHTEKCSAPGVGAARAPEDRGKSRGQSPHPRAAR